MTNIPTSNQSTTRFYFTGTDGEPSVVTVLLSTITDLIQSGILSPETLIREENDTLWKPYSIVIGLQTPTAPEPSSEFQKSASSTTRFYFTGTDGDRSVVTILLSTITDLVQSRVLSPETLIREENDTRWMMYQLVMGLPNPISAFQKSAPSFGPTVNRGKASRLITVVGSIFLLYILSTILCGRPSNECLRAAGGDVETAKACDELQRWMDRQ